MTWYSVKNKLPEPYTDVICILQKFGERYPFYQVMSYEHDKDRKLKWWNEFGNKQEDELDYYEVTLVIACCKA